MYRLRSCRSNVQYLFGLGVISILFVLTTLWIKCGEHSEEHDASSDTRLLSVKRSVGSSSGDNVIPSGKTVDSSTSHIPGSDKRASKLSPELDPDPGYQDADGHADYRDQVPEHHHAEDVHHQDVADHYHYHEDGRRAEEHRAADTKLDTNVKYHKIDCHINDDYQVPCRQEGSEVYLPFSFLNKYFEVYGKLSAEGGVERFDWQHSYSHVYQSSDKYTPDGVFMSFEHYNVEIRDRVKCISGVEAVPVSTQWGAQGYFYPIQIAQYGLSHYSKFIMEEKEQAGKQMNRADIKQHHVISDGKLDDGIAKWKTEGSGTATSELDESTNANVIHFTADENAAAAEVNLPIPEALYDDTSTASNSFILTFALRFVTNGSITVIVEAYNKAGSTSKVYEIHYVSTDLMISATSHHIYYGIGSSTKWRSLTRDVNTDFLKGVAQKYLRNRKHQPRLTLKRIVRIDFRGTGFISNVTIATTAHLAMFFDAADWLVKRQDKRGGWPIDVTRRLAENRLVLPPGWYSAMAQGQAMSLLVRAFMRTNKRAYLESALRATSLFDTPSEQGGVLAKFAGQYVWYEEYPTTPSCFVLNGFIYSLIGLYDVRSVAAGEEGLAADRLYRSGLTSLKALLSLFDTGSGSVYDLKHFTLPGLAPNIARWDYHATHINQLLLLATIDDSDDHLFKTVADRWIGYMKGKRASHN